MPNSRQRRGAGNGSQEDHGKAGSISGRQGAEQPGQHEGGKVSGGVSAVPEADQVTPEGQEVVPRLVLVEWLAPTVVLPHGRWWVRFAQLPYCVDLPAGCSTTAMTAKWWSRTLRMNTTASSARAAGT